MSDIHDIHDHDGAESISEEQRALDQITHILLHALTEDGIGEKLEAAKSQQDVYKALQTVPYFKLTIDEFRKYRRFIPLTSKPFWTATPWTTLRSPYSVADNAYYIYTDGAVNRNNVCLANVAPRPALYLQSSILVSVETEDEEKVLADYTDTELMDELYRRRRATYDAG